MQESHIKHIKNDFPAIRHIRILNNDILPGGDWFIFDAAPRPSRGEINSVISDIDDNSIVYVNRMLEIVHSNMCTKKRHTLKHDILEKLDNVIKDDTFRIAVWEGNSGINNGQPIAFSIDPEISYSVYPDHPHISALLLYHEGSKDYLLPNSLCYNYQSTVIEDCTYDVMRNSLHYIALWLFCNQVWLITRRKGTPIWIGPQELAEELDQFKYLRHPYKPCRCGNGVLYEKCHLSIDFQNIVASSPAFVQYLNIPVQQGTFDLDYRGYGNLIDQITQNQKCFIDRLRAL